MKKGKAKFKVGDKFFHPGQGLFVVVDDVSHYPGQDKGWLYTLKCFKHEKDEAKPWKRYYEHRILSELMPMKLSAAANVLYGN